MDEVMNTGAAVSEETVTATAQTAEEAETGAASAGSGLPERRADGMRGEADPPGTPGGRIPSDAEKPADGEGEAAPASPQSTQPEKAQTEEESEPPSISLSVGGEEKTYTPEEAAPLVENGLKWQAFQESYDKLEYLAETIGKDIPALVDAMMASSEEAAVEKLKEQCGGNEEVAKKLYAYQKQERLSKLGEKKAASLRSKEEMTKAQRDKLQDTLAQGYIELAKEIPDKFPSFKDVPRPVVDSQANQSIDAANSAAANATASAVVAEGAAGRANAAAQAAEEVAQEVQGKLDRGELTGPKGDKGDTGPQGEKGEKGEAGKAPYIGEDGQWYAWDEDSGAYEDTGVSSTTLVDENSGQRVRMWFGTIAEYNALPEIRADTYYNILEGVVP